jgi:hypothetical protein
MKIVITMTLCASFIAASSGTTAEGIMKAIAQIDRASKPLVRVVSAHRRTQANYIRELHGDIDKPRVVDTLEMKRARRLAEFKVMLKKQKQKRLLGLSKSTVTSMF